MELTSSPSVQTDPSPFPSRELGLQIWEALPITSRATALCTRQLRITWAKRETTIKLSTASEARNPSLDLSSQGLT